MLYIAYGSNISSNRMHQRCPSARFVTKGFLEDTALCFHYYANIEPVEGYTTPAVLWDIPEAEIRALDRAEGFPKHYSKEHHIFYPDPNVFFLIEDMQTRAEKMIDLVGAENVHVARDFMDTPSGILGTAYVMTDWKKNEWEKHDQQTPIEYVEHLLAGYKEHGFDKEKGFGNWYLKALWYALYRGEAPPELRI